MLEIENVSKTFILKSQNAEIKPLQGANLTIRDGARLGLIGKSGEGKSTLGRIICGFEVPDEGNVLIDGKQLFKKGKYNRKLGLKIQMIPQQPYQSLDPMQKVGASIVEALLVSHNARGHKAALKKAQELFIRVGLDLELFERLPRQLSGGQAQRVVIARCLAVKPEVIISDEATSMLDVSTQASIVKLLKEINTMDGVSILFISHDESLVKAFSKESYRLKDGCLSIIKTED